MRITDDSGVKSEIDPADHMNVRAELRTLPDGRKLARKWIRGWLPLEDGAGGQFIYRRRKESDITDRLLLTEGAGSQTLFREIRGERTSFAGKVGVLVERVEEAPLGECQATFVTIAITFSGADRATPYRLWLLFVRELDFFIAEAHEEEHGGPRILFRATRIELMQ